MLLDGDPLRKSGMNLRWLLEKVAGHFGLDTESLDCSASRSRENG
jgi:hypothetical protein